MIKRWKKERRMKCQLQKRFGFVAVEKGFITAGQLLDALQIQAKENIEQSEHRLIGQILLEKGYPVSTMFSGFPDDPQDRPSIPVPSTFK
jgi:hypothetical protein